MAYIFFVQIPQENAVVLTAAHHPLAFYICSDECCEQAKMLIYVPCTHIANAVSSYAKGFGLEFIMYAPDPWGNDMCAC